MSSDGKIAIVTGASRGIGAAIAGRLADDGFTVVINYVGKEAEASAQVAHIRERGGYAIAVRADVSKPDEVSQLFAAAQQEAGTLAVLVNNAGVMPLAAIADANDDLFERTVAVNMKGAFNGMREAAKRMPDGGRIINFSSSVVGLYQPSYGVYAATKAAVEALTHVLANELRGRDITVNCVAPGPTATDLFFNGKSPELIERLRKLAPLERLGQPADIAAVVSFLAGPDGAWINGQVIRANGGVI